jgi:hypothetical protein
MFHQRPQRSKGGVLRIIGLTAQQDVVHEEALNSPKSMMAVSPTICCAKQRAAEPEWMMRPDLAKGVECRYI